MIRVHSWFHSYPHAKRTKGFNKFIEIGGPRTWSSLARLKKDTKGEFELVYHGCMDMWEVVGAKPIDCFKI